jgi:uncharacterized membrane protein YdjX (TVP38/TMEM64 family)
MASAPTTSDTSDADPHPSPPRSPRRWVWPLASLIALPYFVTSLVVVLNSIGNATGAVWLPSFPTAYYAFARLLYLPFSPYFALLSPLQANPGVSYTTYAVVSRAPFLILPLLIWGFTFLRWRATRTPGDGRERLAGGRSGLSPRLPTSLLLLLAGGTLLVVLYLAVAPLRATVDAGIAALDPRDLSRFRDFLLSFGPWAPVISFLLMVLQSVIAPLPAPVITVTNGLLFGAFWGTVLSWSSAMVGAALCFAIARALGRPVVERLAGTGPLARTDAFFARYGSAAVLVARLIPIVSFDVVSYAAGLTRMGIVPFLVATGIGQLPATIVYSVLGQNLSSGSRGALWALGALLSLVVIGFAARSRILQRLPAPASSPDPIATAAPAPVPQRTPATTRNV